MESIADIFYFRNNYLLISAERSKILSLCKFEIVSFFRHNYSPLRHCVSTDAVPECYLSYPVCLCLPVSDLGTSTYFNRVTKAMSLVAAQKKGSKITFTYRQKK